MITNQAGAAPGRPQHECECLSRAATAHTGTQHVRFDSAVGRRPGGRCRPPETVSDGVVLIFGLRLDPRCLDLVRVAGGDHLADCGPENAATAQH